jgi:hypothetical protein
LLPLALTIVALAVGLSACGGDAPAAPDTTATTITSANGAGGPTVVNPTEPAGACASQLSGLLKALEHLRRSLVIGVSYEQYVSELGTVRESYQGIPVAQLDLACVTGPASSAEESFDGYLAAANTWGACVSEDGCETATLEPKLQRRWQLAAGHLAEAKQGLEHG